MNDIKPKPEEMLNIEGEKGSSLFYRTLMQVVDQNNINSTQIKIDNYLGKIKKTSDDRALAIVGALIIENELDNFLKTWIKNYSQIQENKDSTFSFKIELAISLKLIPKWILNAIDPIRKIRNIFAHNFDIDTFENAKKSNSEHFIILNNKIKLFLKYWDNNEDKKTFEQLIIMIVLALDIYTKHIFKVQEFIWNSENLHKIINS